MGFFKSFSRKVNYQSRFDAQPKLDHQLININDSCLEIKGYLGESHLIIGWMGTWTFIVMALPFIIVGNYGLITAGEGPVDWSSVSYLGILFLLIVNFFVLAMSLGVSWFNIRSLKKTSLIRFNRQTQKVHATVLGHECEADWQNIKAEFAVQRMVYGGVVETRDVVRINMKDRKNPEYGQAAVIEATYSLDTQDDGCEMVWEFIRRFMFNGPDKLPIIPNNRLDDFGKFQQVSYGPRRALEKRWFWPIYSSHDTTDVKWMHIIFWPLKVILFIPNLLADIIWHWMVEKLGGGFAKLPTQSGEGCSDHWITPYSLNSIVKNGEKYITYAEARKRGAKETLIS